MGRKTKEFVPMTLKVKELMTKLRRKPQNFFVCFDVMKKKGDDQIVLDFCSVVCDMEAEDGWLRIFISDRP